MKDFFLCHSSLDKESLVRPVNEELSMRNYSTWFDEIQIQPCMNFYQIILEGLEQAHAVVVFLTENSLDKEWPMKEINEAMSMNKPIIPVIFNLSVDFLKRKLPFLDETLSICSEDTEEIGRRIVNAYISMVERDKKKPESLKTPSNLETCKGTILHPVGNTSVNRYINAEGNIIGFAENDKLWLAVEIGGLKWPKAPGVSVDNMRWTGEAFEGGMPPNGEFVLSLYVVGKEGNDEIKKWLEEGHRKNDYPGIKELKDARRLDSVRLKLR